MLSKTTGRVTYLECLFVDLLGPSGRGVISLMDLTTSYTSNRPWVLFADKDPSGDIPESQELSHYLAVSTVHNRIMVARSGSPMKNFVRHTFEP